MERGRMNGNGNYDFSFESNDYDRLDRVEVYAESTPNGKDSGKLSQTVSSPGASCIVHPVSKLDTLAGVAIKYGVEVADIKKMNGLVTDFQMFALKSLQIPLPGRHPPSPLLNGSNTPGESSSEKNLPTDFFQSFHSLKTKPSQQKVSPAMSSLQGYYGLESPDQKKTIEGFEMAVYRKGNSHYLEDGPFSGTTNHNSNMSLHHHRKSKSLVSGFLGEKCDLTDIQLSAEAAGDVVGDPKWNEKLIRRRQKSVADFTNSSDILMKDDNGGINGFLGKGLAQRPKSSNRVVSANEAENGLMMPIPVGMGDSFVTDAFASVRKSSSTSNLPDQENGGIAASSTLSSSSTSIWSTSKWNLKPDLQAISSASRPIFDGLPKPLTGRRNKAALD